MRLKSFGCSFIFGIDLHDDSRLMPKATASNFTWPALLAKHHGFNYTCYARPGIGNLQITEKLITQALNIEPAFFVVGWTWIDRFDYTTQATPPEWKTIMPIDTDKIASVYYKDIHSEIRDKLTTLINVKASIDVLKEHGHKFIMTYIDDLMFDDRWNTTPAIVELQRYCKPYMTNFDGKSFLDFSRHRGFEISPTLHPLEEAHEAAFNLINSYNLVQL